MLGRLGYKFTKKKNPNKGIMSTSLGLIATCSICLAVYLAYLNKGIALPQYGMVLFLSLIFSVTGLVLGIISCTEKDIYRFFPVLGVILNAIAVSMCAAILYIGIG